MTDRPKRVLRYEREPSAIYAQSFATVRSEARMDRFTPSMQPIITRLIHSCGMVEIADRLAFTDLAAKRGTEALANGAPILCDCEMVGSGIIRRYLPADNSVIVTLNDAGVPDLAKEIGNTRSAAAVELWRDHIEGAVVAIGNAPTALFHLLELLDAGWPKPACILGFPVGFVGAAESKAELAARSRGCEFVALRGRKGGSAMASAARTKTISWACQLVGIHGGSWMIPAYSTIQSGTQTTAINPARRKNGRKPSASTGCELQPVGVSSGGVM